MTAGDAYRTAQALAEHGLNADTATTADLDAAADHTDSTRPANRHDRHTVRDTLDTIGDQP